MLHDHLLLVIGLLFAVTLLASLGTRLRIATPLLLVLGGLAIACVPGLPHIQLEPNLVFLLFLPPLLYEAAWFTSWREFWKWKRSIAMLAFGLVLFTSTVVAYVTAAVIPGFTLALGFLLGGIISPPDAVAATSVLKGLPIPKRAITILEGESLVNDASSLIVFRFALAAVMTGHFSASQAVQDFLVAAAGGVVVGVALAAAIYKLHRALPTTPSIDTALTLLSPYVMYLAAEHFHCSGVMSVVSGGLFLSYRAHSFLDYRSRIQANAVWTTLVFVLNGLVFILIGLAMPEIRSLLTPAEFWSSIGYGLMVSAIVIVVRFLWMYPAAHIPRVLVPSIAAREPNPGVRMPTILAWAGMRGVVSLAAALSIPTVLPDGAPFPQRGVLLVVTFVVILVTLVGQGITLPRLVRALDVGDVDRDVPEEEQDLALRAELTGHAVAHLEELEAAGTPHATTVKQRYARLHARHQAALTEHAAAGPRNEERALLLSLVAHQRRALLRLRAANAYGDEVLRKAEHALDLEEERITE